MANLFSDIRRFIEGERDLFGETLMVDMPPPGEEPMPARKHTKSKSSASEAMLFNGDDGRKKEAWEDATSLKELEEKIHDCTKCDLWRARTNFVFGTGNPKATLMLVGEAPGADEDAQGEPFVGRAGQLLNKILAAIDFKREDVYICNILKSRPPGNRTPLPEEIEACIPYLKKQIALVRPKLILCLGLTAAHNLLGNSESLSSMRGRVLEYEDTPLMVTYHPAALLRNPNWKRPAWEDIQAARKLHDKLVSAKKT